MNPHVVLAVPVPLLSIFVLKLFTTVSAMQ